MKKINILALVVSVAIPLITGAISAALSANGMAAYGSMVKPPLTPPPWVFSVAWTVLYISMGIAAYIVLESEAGLFTRYIALLIYALQLAMNFMWSLYFFNWRLYLFAFIWLLILWVMVVICAFKFYSINKLAGFLMIPYILWLSFAGYLNYGAYLLSTVPT